MTSPDPARQRAEDLLTCPTHPVIETVCAHVLKKIEQAIQAVHQAGRVVGLKEAADYAKQRTTTGGKPVDEYEQGMRAEAILTYNNLRNRIATTPRPQP